jgi:hypothetical protein
MSLLKKFTPFAAFMCIKKKLLMVFFLLLSNNVYATLFETCSKEFGTCYVALESDILGDWDYFVGYGRENFDIDLAAIHSQEEMSFVDSWVRDDLFSSTKYYIGGEFNDSSCQDFVWVSGAIFNGYENWSANEPNNCSTQRAVAVDLTGQWLTVEKGSTDVRGAVYSYAYTPPAVPVPEATWLFGVGLLALIGISKHKKA